MNVYNGLAFKDLNELSDYNLAIIDDIEHLVINTLKENLETLGISGTTLSKMTGISKQTISDILNNKKTPGVDFVLKISTVLNIPVESWIELSENAWVERLVTDNQPMFIDLKELTVITSDKLKAISNKECKEYIDLNTFRVLTEEDYNSLLEDWYEKNTSSIEEELLKTHSYNKRNLKLALASSLKETFSKRYTQRFKKLGRVINHI